MEKSMALSRGQLRKSPASSRAHSIIHLVWRSLRLAHRSSRARPRSWRANDLKWAPTIKWTPRHQRSPPRRPAGQRGNKNPKLKKIPPATFFLKKKRLEGQRSCGFLLYSFYSAPVLFLWLTACDTFLYMISYMWMSVENWDTPAKARLTEFFKIDIFTKKRKDDKL